MSQKFWADRSNQVARRVNLALWLSAFLPAFVIASLVSAALLLLFRSIKFPTEIVWSIWALTLLAASLVIVRRIRPALWTPADAMVRLETVGALQGRLSAAGAGIGRWPDEREAGDGFRLRWKTLLVPAALSISFFLLAAFIPMPKPPEKLAGGEISEPPAWPQAEKWLETLKEEKVAEPEALEKFQQQIEQLRKKDRKEWYSQSSLEAGENLKEKLEASIEGLASNLESADAALESAAEAGTNTTNLELSAAALSKALQSMEAGALPANPALMKNLEALANAGALKQLSASQLGEMRKSVQGAIKGAAQCLKPGRIGKLEKGTLVGRGGINRGPGAAPQTLTDPVDRLNETAEGVSSEDLKNASIGDTIKVERSAPETENSTVSGTGGTTSNPGAGGSTVWKNAVTPREREVLKRYFE